MNILEFQGWLYTEMFVPQNLSVLLTCNGVNELYVNDESYVGNIYGNSVIKASLSLIEGMSIIRLHVKGKQTVRVKCTIEESTLSNHYKVFPNVVIPDLLEGELTGEYIGVVISNNHVNNANIEATVYIILK